MKILFFGTPRFAEIVLKGMLDAGEEIVGVVCQNDKPAGRGNKLQAPKIKDFALERGLPVYQFERLKDHIEDFKSIDYDLAVTASYGKLLPKEFLDIKPCINVHPSLLPKYRGATPIQSALLNGDKVSGVSIMKTEVGMDDGDVFVQKEVEIDESDDYVSLLDKLAIVGLDLLLKTLQKIKMGTAETTPQNHSMAVFVKPIQKEEGLLDFSKSTESLVNKVRAFCESPVAYFFLGEDRIKVFKAKSCDMSIDANVGEVVENKKRFLIKAGDGKLFEILECQAPGGKRLAANVFLNGYRFKTRKVSVCC